MAVSIYNMGNYFKSLLPSFKRKDVITDALHSFEELSTTIQSAYSLAIPELKGKTLDNTTVQFKRQINSFDKSTFKTIAKAIDIILDNQDKITEVIHSEFTDETLKINVDYYKLNLLKYLEAINLFNDYTRMWLNAVVYETLVEKNILVGIDSPTIKKDIAHVNSLDLISSFATAVNMLAIPFSEFLTSIKSLKGHLYNESDWDSGHNIINNKLDPFRSNFLPVNWNPFYHLGLMVNAWRMAKYERNKAELARLQLMLLSLDQQKEVATSQEKKDNLEKQIKYYSNLSNKISAKIEDLEESAR